MHPHQVLPDHRQGLRENHHMRALNPVLLLLHRRHVLLQLVVLPRRVAVLVIVVQVDAEAELRPLAFLALQVDFVRRAQQPHQLLADHQA